MIPLVKLQALRRGLSEVYPELAKKDFISTRMCWYVPSSPLLIAASHHAHALWPPLRLPPYPTVPPRLSGMAKILTGTATQKQATG